MADQRSVIVQESWAGGLNLADDSPSVADIELTEACDVEISPSGGVCSRRPVAPYVKNAPLASPVCSMWEYEIPDGIDGAKSWMMFQTEDGKVWMMERDTGVVQPAPIPDNPYAPPTGLLCCYHGWQAAGKLYVSNGAKVWRWDGVGAPVDVTTTSVHPDGDEEEISNLGVLANCDATTANGLVFLLGGLFASSDIDTLWWSNAIFEQEGNPNVPDGQVAGQEDFYKTRRHTFTAGAAGDRVERVVACGKTLYVFKRHSTYAFGPGSGGAEFAAQDISTDIGIANPKALTCFEDVAYVFDERKGLYALSGGSYEWLFRPVYPLLQCGDIKQTRTTAVGACDRKIFVSVDMEGEGKNTDTLVYDLVTRSWVWWKIGFDCFYNYCPSKIPGACLAAVSSPCPTIVRLDHCLNTLVDDFGCAQVRFTPRFSTAWYDDRLPYVDKSFRRTEVLLVHEGGAKIATGHAKNWEPCSFQEGRVIEVESKFDDIMVWDEDTWPVGLTIVNGDEVVECPPHGVGPVWGPPSENGTIAPMAMPGQARAVRFGFVDCGSSERWCITTLTTFYDPKPIGC